MASRIVQAPAAYAFPPGSGCRLLDQPVRFVSPGIYARDWECRSGNGLGRYAGGDLLTPEQIARLGFTRAGRTILGSPPAGGGQGTSGVDIGTVLLVVGGLAVVGVGAGLLFRRARR